MNVPVAAPERRRAGAAFDLAARASGAAEQIRTIEALQADGVAALSGSSLSSLDAWKLRRLARSLALDGLDARPGKAVRSAEELEAVLTAHRLVEPRAAGVG